MHFIFAGCERSFVLFRLRSFFLDWSLSCLIGWFSFPRCDKQAVGISAIVRANLNIPEVGIRFKPWTELLLNCTVKIEKSRKGVVWWHTRDSLSHVSQWCDCEPKRIHKQSHYKSLIESILVLCWYFNAEQNALISYQFILNFIEQISVNFWLLHLY